jgi:thiamine transport system ATP-binding protein
MSAELAVDDVSVAFAGRVVLDDVELSIAASEVVGLLGPSGSGKSTLLRVIAGLLAPDRGAVRIDGVDVTGMPTHRRGVGMVFQDEQLFEHVDVAGNVGFGLRMRGDDAAARRQRVAELLQLVGLAGFEHRNVRQLSGGEAKRVALARSLAPSPRVLLLDEPLTGLDRQLHDRLVDDLARILRTERTTTLLVTHDADEATAIADRVVAVEELVGRGVVGSRPMRATERQRRSGYQRPARPANATSVEEVAVEDIYMLRMDVLRRGTPSDNVDFPHDRDPETIHFAVRDEAGAVIAASTWTPRPFPDEPDVPAIQLRGMAVSPDHQRRGLGALMIAAGFDAARRRGAVLVWANARDSALDFYVASGFTVSGPGFRTTDTDLPHHRIVHRLSPESPGMQVSR